MPKCLVVCCDGTWNTPDQKDRGQVRPSNVAKTALTLAPRSRDGREQVLYYDRGVGTGGWWDRLVGGAFGHGLGRNIKSAYRFLVKHYEEGDEIFLFGFSRGAYTVRSTAGLLRNCGLLRREHAQRLGEAYRLYRRRDPQSHPESFEARIFRRMYAQTVRIKFIGVWDTVGALGIPLDGLRLVNRLLGLEFHDVKLSSYVEHAYQALAIDEKRRPFRPAVWERQAHSAHQTLEQAWFAGTHSNVGGGYADTGLSDLAFMWMKERAEACGLAFDARAIERLGVRPCWNGVLRDSKTGLYRRFRDHHREIGRAPNGNESVHPSVWRRVQARADYRPVNLPSRARR